MKKLVMALLCVGLLYGCNSAGYDTTVSNKDKVIITGSGLNITNQDYFEYLMNQTGPSAVLDQALMNIADKELTDQDAIDKAVKEAQDSYAQYANGSLEDYAKQLGYDSVDDYTQQKIIPEVKTKLLIEKYIDKNFDQLIKDYQVSSFKKITVDKESTALSLIKDIKSEDDFNKKMEEYGSDSEDAGVVTKNSALDDNLKKSLGDLSEVDKDGVYKEAIKLSDDKYAVIYLYDTAHKNKDKIKTALTSDTAATDEIKGKYLSQYHFEVYDEKIKKGIKDLSSQFIE